MLGDFDRHSPELQSSSNSSSTLWDSLFSIPSHIVNLFSTAAQSSAVKLKGTEEILLPKPATDSSSDGEGTDSDYDSELDADFQPNSETDYESDDSELDADFQPNSETDYESDDSELDADFQPDSESDYESEESDCDNSNESEDLNDDSNFDFNAYLAWKTKEIKKESAKRLKRETDTSDSECNKNTKRHCKR
ncbi:hypothetical protein [Candidatus Berkiella aquae]|uniref:MSCRAMM family adhesin SdrC n=1 Tax=Candidatus Berkiella aquae TaxID=295108 RepID=A0A0Q9YV65_9GAMM|nr:hypothetical protein [Candidatus Berkiella aquae]MCS5710648.1 MSCRAMM family adhesin SdrC [Candidatus Berkiella aquae]